MTLSDLLIELGYRGISLRYAENVQLVVFFINANRENPAVTMSGAIISVGTMPFHVHGKIAETRTLSPLAERRDFDLHDPNSIDMIGDYLAKMVTKCERRKLKEPRMQKCVRGRKIYMESIDDASIAVKRIYPKAIKYSSPGGFFWESGNDVVAEVWVHQSREGWWLRVYRR